MSEEICAHLPDETPLLMIADPSDPDLQEWLDQSSLSTRIEVQETFPDCPDSVTGIAFVVNSAYLHKATIQVAMAAGYHVVCEKPIAFSRQDVCDLMDLARGLELELFCTNTFLFSTYFERFRDDFLKTRKFKGVRISWADPSGESRHGVTKKFDSGVPLIFDVLPHVANILLGTIGEFTAVPVRANFSNGGSRASLVYQTRNLIVEVELARNSSQRRRTIEFFADHHNILIDFADDPATVRENSGPSTAINLDWRNEARPISAMLLSVQQYFASGVLDDRLSCVRALKGLELIESVVDGYIVSQLSLLENKPSERPAHMTPADFAYALKEATSLTTRVLPLLPDEHPLCRLKNLSL